MNDRATTLFYNASIIQDIKQKLYSHTLFVSPEPILFDMKSIPNAFPQHTKNYSDIHIIIVFYKVADEGRAIISHVNAFTCTLDLLFELAFPSDSRA